MRIKQFAVVCPHCKESMLTSTATKALVDGQGFVKCKNKECREWFVYMTITTPQGTVTGHSYDHLSKDYDLGEAQKVIKFLTKSGVRTPRPVRMTIEKGRRFAKRRAKSKKNITVAAATPETTEGEGNALQSSSSPPDDASLGQSSICSQCGFDIPPGALYCWSCGLTRGESPRGLPKWWPYDQKLLNTKHDKTIQKSPEEPLESAASGESPPKTLRAFGVKKIGM